MASNGFMAAISRNPGSALTRPSLGTAISPSVSTVIRTLSVSSGTRLNSSRYSSPPARMACSSGPSVKLAATYPSVSTWAGSYWPISRAGVSSAFPSTNTTWVPRSRAMDRSSVDLRVPGGPSRTTCPPASSATVSSSRSRRRPTTCGTTGESASVMQDEPPDVLAVPHVLVALVDLVERVGIGDQLVQLEVAGLVQADLERDVTERVAGAEEAALDPLLHQRQHRAVDLDVVGDQVAEAGDDDRARLADGVERVGHYLGGDGAGGDDGLVRHDAAGQSVDEEGRLARGGTAVRGSELLGGLALERDRVDGDDIAGAGQGRALHRVDTDAADAVDDDRVARLDRGRVHGRTPAGWHAAADERDLVQRQVVIDLHARKLRDGGVLGERAQHAHAANILAVGGVEPVGAVEQPAVQDRRAEVAQVGLARGAPAAVPADREERTDDVVAGLEPGHAGADLLDHARALVAAHDREPRGQVAGADVLVGVAQAGSAEADEALADLRRVELELGDLPVLPGFAHNRCLGLHPLSRVKDVCFVVTLEPQAFLEQSKPIACLGRWVRSGQVRCRPGRRPGRRCRPARRQPARRRSPPRPAPSAARGRCAAPPAPLASRSRRSSWRRAWAMSARSSPAAGAVAGPIPRARHSAASGPGRPPARTTSRGRRGRARG